MKPSKEVEAEQERILKKVREKVEETIAQYTESIKAEDRDLEFPRGSKISLN